MREFDRFRLQLFARRGGRNYMMRSEKRPSYNRPQPAARRLKRRRTNAAYLVLTLIVAILLWPAGLFLIWNRRLRCGVGGKILWSVVTLAVFCGLILALLTVPTGNEDFQRFQDDANDFIETVCADASVAWETFSERAGDAFGNMRSVACSMGNFALNKAADGIEGGVELGRGVRGWISGLFPAEDEQSPAAEGDEDVAPSSRPEESPAPSDAPTASASPDGVPSEDQLDAAQLAVAGLALNRAGLRDSQTASVAPQTQMSTVVPEMTPYPTPTPRSANAPGVSEGPEIASAPTATPEATAETTPEASEAAPDTSETAEPTDAREATETAGPETAAPTEAPAPRVTPQPAMAAPTPTPEADAPVEGPVAARDAGEYIVYHTENGRYYHTSATCSGMLGAEEHTLASSVEDGFEACPDCNAPAAELLDAENVVWVDEDSVYHISDECSAFAGEEARLMTAQDAEDAECVPCAACGANAIDTGAQEEARSEEELLEEAKEVTVYFYDGSRSYHAESTCIGMSGAPERTLYEAIEMDKPPCANCEPPTLEDLQ